MRVIFCDKCGREITSQDDCYLAGIRRDLGDVPNLYNFELCTSCVKKLLTYLSRKR